MIGYPPGFKFTRKRETNGLRMGIVLIVTLEIGMIMDKGKENTLK